jgi:apolipoprotein N-acyltransferase
LPGFVNGLVRQGEPELLANLTNDAWFGDSTEPWIHLALAKFRAVEQRKFFVRSTNSGVSAFIDPVGRVISSTKTFEEAAQHATLRWLKGTTPYTLWGDKPWYLVSLLSFALAFLRKKGSAAEPTAAPPLSVGIAAGGAAAAAAPEPATEPKSGTPESTPDLATGKPDRPASE